MLRNQSIQTFTKFSIVLSSLAIIACNKIVPFPPTVVEHPAGQKFNTKVELLITQPFLDTRWSDGRGNEQIILLGEPFSQNAEHLTRLLFTDVVVSRPTDPPTNPKVDAILTPTVVSIKKSRPALGGYDMQTTVVYEWRLTDFDQNIIWVKSITSKVLSPLGTMLTGWDYAEKHVTLLLNDLFTKSYDAMSASTEIKEFSQSRQK